MQLDPTRLTNDPHLREVLAQLVGRIETLEREKSRLEEQVRSLFNKLFGRRTEKLDPNQLELVFEAMRDLGVPPAQLEALEVEVVKHRRPAGRQGRQALPKDLPRERVEHPLPAAESCCSSCGEELTKIREEISEQLEYTPAAFKVLEHARGVYACKACEETIARAPKAPQAIDKGLPGPGLLAHVVASKYVDHQPLYRQQQAFARSGIELSRSTLCDWVAEAAELVTPLVDWMRADLLASRIVQTDDTPVTVLDSQSGSHKGRLWVYLGDRGHPHVVFDYTPTREGEGPERFLKGFRGYLQADAYGGYDALYAAGEVQEVGCWAHARRYFYDAAETSGDSRAYGALGFIRQLFAVERETQELTAQERQRRRYEQAVPVLDAFRLWLDEYQREALPKSALGRAIGYSVRQWDALRRYLDEGELSADNNASERALRAVAIGRKNWLFAGSDAGGVRAAKLYTVIASAKRHQLEPYAYLRMLCERLPTHPASRLHELAPPSLVAAPNTAAA